MSALCGVAVAVAILSFLRHASGLMGFPYELAAGEELLLRDAVQILGGRAIYTDVNYFPFVVSNYPPLFALVSSLLLPLVGVSFAATRLVSAVSTILCACLIGAIAYQGTGARMPSALCAGVFLGSLFVYQWGAWGRVDSAAVLFSLVAILLALRWRHWQGVCVAALFCLFSIYTKQTQFAAPLAILAWLLWRRERVQALAFAAVLGGLGGLVFVLLNGVTSGEFFRHLVVYNALPYSWRALFGYWRAFGATHAVILGMALAQSGVSLRRRHLSLPVLYFVASGALTVATGRAGASTNYFLELIAASLILCGLSWGGLWKQGGYAAAVVPAALLVQLVWFNVFAYTPLRAFYDPLPSFGYTPRPGDLPACQAVDGYVAGAEGQILTEGGGFALKNGKELYGSPWLLSALEPTGLVDEGLLGLEETLRERRYSLVILTWQSYPPRILNEVWANYQRVDTVDCVFTYEIFVPRAEA